ncbi:MAG: toll/interleukin-1 receptor domain-containing protein [Gammaproteobacteria bacterium]|nr:toll/interleukin-1 receptor domain-containing protein [Gammaproteobacteria bacterium]
MRPRGVFVSYSQSDREPAFGIVSRLEGAGIDCWIAPRDVTPAADWAAEIVEAITAARVMVLVFSASTNDSPQVRREVERAVHHRVAVLPFRIADVLPSKSLEYFLSSQHWLDAFPPPLAPHYTRLIDHVRAFLGAEPVAPAAASGSFAAPGAATGSVAAASGPATTGTVPALIEPAQLKRFETELAHYIGPLARHLVKRAAASAAGPESLIVMLGTEIESEAERGRFVNACRQFLRSGK